MKEQKTAKHVKKSKSRAIKEKKYAKLSKLKLKKKKKKEEEEEEEEEEERPKRELNLRQSSSALSENSSVYAVGRVSTTQPMHNGESDTTTVSSPSPEAQDHTQVGVLMDGDFTRKNADAIGTSKNTTPQRSKSGQLTVAPSDEEVQKTTYTLDAGKQGTSAFSRALKSIPTKSATTAEDQEGVHVALSPAVSVIEKHSSAEHYAPTDETFLEIQETEAQIMRYVRSLRFHENEVANSLRIRKPYRRFWFLYSTEFYKLWRKAAAEEDTWDYPTLLVGRIRAEKGEDRQSGNVRRHRVEIALILGKAEYLTGQFELPMYNTDPPAFVRAYEQNGEKWSSFDVEVFFLGKGYMELHIPSKVVAEAVGGGLADHADLDTDKCMVFYGVQAAAGDGG